jgi:predicted RNA-binding protein
MDQVQVALEYFHSDHLRWRNELEFSREEIKIFNHRLEDVVKATSDHELMAEVEHFQNQFIRENELIDTLLHKVGIEEKWIGKLARQAATTIEQFDMMRHLELAGELVTFSRLYADLRYTFSKFLMRGLKGVLVSSAAGSN